MCCSKHSLLWICNLDFLVMYKVVWLNYSVCGKSSLTTQINTYSHILTLSRTCHLKYNDRSKTKSAITLVWISCLERLILSLFQSIILRYYVAEGVRIYNQKTWKEVTEGQGKELLEQYIQQVVSVKCWEIIHYYHHSHKYGGGSFFNVKN